MLFENNVSPPVFCSLSSRENTLASALTPSCRKSTLRSSERPALETVTSNGSTDPRMSGGGNSAVALADVCGVAERSQSFQRRAEAARHPESRTPAPASARSPPYPTLTTSSAFSRKLPVNSSQHGSRASNGYSLYSHHNCNM